MITRGVFTILTLDLDLLARSNKWSGERYTGLPYFTAGLSANRNRGVFAVNLRVLQRENV